MSDKPTPLQDRLGSMVHAFSDEQRKYAVRLLAADVGKVERELNAANDRIKRLEAGDAALTYSIVLDLQKENLRLQDRFKRLEEALESIREYWNRDNNERAMEDACWNAIHTASKARKAKEAKL